MSNDKVSIPLAVIGRIMKEALPDSKFGKDAKIEFEKQLVEFAISACQKAGEYTTAAKRKTVNAADVKSAFDSM